MSDSDKDGNKSKPSGRVRHDSSGRAVWEWAVDSSRDAIDSTSRLLKKLNLSGLHLLDDNGKPADKPAAEEDAFSVEKRMADPKAGTGRDFNPYDSRTAARRKTSGKPQQPPKPRITQPVRPSKPPGLFSRLFGKGKR